MTTANKKIIVVLITFLILFMPTEIFAGPHALGNLYLIGVYILLFLIICTLSSIGLIILLKKRKLKSKLLKILLYSLAILLASIYLPTLGWFLWEVAFEDVLWSLDVKGVPTEFIFICLFILTSFFIIKKIMHYINKDEMPNTSLKRDAASNRHAP